jgi:hypothetical protein
MLDRAHQHLDSVKNISLVFARGLGQEPNYCGPAPRSIQMTNRSMFLVVSDLKFSLKNEVTFPTDMPQADKIIITTRSLKTFVREQSITETGILVDILKLKEKALVLCNVEDPGED